MAYPAASSAAVLMRRPEDRRCIAVETASLDWSRLRWVSIAEMLVRIERDIRYTSMVRSLALCPSRLHAGLTSGVIVGAPVRLSGVQTRLDAPVGLRPRRRRALRRPRPRAAPRPPGAQGARPDAGAAARA